MKTFAEIVNKVRKLDDDQLLELEWVIKTQLIQKKRKSIRKNYQQAKAEHKAKKLTFSGNLSTLKEML
jgi:hypothetical protein